MDKNSENDTKNFEDGDGFDILASHERLYHLIILRCYKLYLQSIDQEIINKVIKYLRKVSV